MITRPKTRKRFTRISSESLEDGRIGCEGRSILFYLLTKRDDWTVSLKQVEHALNMSMYAVKKGMLQLEAVGYVRLVPGRSKNGRYGGWRWDISELPIWTATNRTKSKRLVKASNRTKSERLASDSPIARNHQQWQNQTIRNPSDIVTTNKSSNYYARKGSNYCGSNSGNGSNGYSGSVPTATDTDTDDPFGFGPSRPSGNGPSLDSGLSDEEINTDAF